MSKRKNTDEQPALENGEQKPKESKTDRFQRLAGRRMTVALKRIAHVANLGNKGQYEYTDEQAQRIIDALNEAVIRVKAAFTGRKEVQEFFQV